MKVLKQFIIKTSVIVSTLLLLSFTSVATADSLCSMPEKLHQSVSCSYNVPAAGGSSPVPQLEFTAIGFYVCAFTAEPADSKIIAIRGFTSNLAAVNLSFAKNIKDQILTALHNNTSKDGFVQVKFGNSSQNSVKVTIKCVNTKLE